MSRARLRPEPFPLGRRALRRLLRPFLSGRPPRRSAGGRRYRHGTVAFDAFSSSAAGTGDLSWTHTPVGTPRAVIVLLVQPGDLSNTFTAVTYGGVGLTNVVLASDVSGEPGASWLWFLGAGIPTGAQTVFADSSGTTHTHRGGAVTLTAAADTEVVDSDEIGTDATNPSVTLQLGGRTCFAAIGFFSGQNAVTGITPLANWNARLEHDFGSTTGGWYTFNTVGSADVTAGYTAGADDCAMCAVAVSEVQALQVDEDHPWPAPPPPAPGPVVTVHA